MRLRCLERDCYSFFRPPIHTACKRLYFMPLEALRRRAAPVVARCTGNHAAVQALSPDGADARFQGHGQAASSPNLRGASSTAPQELIDVKEFTAGRSCRNVDVLLANATLARGSLARAVCGAASGQLDGGPARCGAAGYRTAAANGGSRLRRCTDAREVIRCELYRRRVGHHMHVKNRDLQRASCGRHKYFDSRGIMGDSVTAVTEYFRNT